MQIKTRAKDKKSAKGKGKAKETASIGPQAQNTTRISSPGGTLGTEGLSSLRRTLRAHGPSNPNPPLDNPAMDTDDDKDPGDITATDSDADDEAAFTRSIYTKTSSGNPKKIGYCLNPKDPANFLKLASALNIFLSDTLTDNQINEADNLIQEYNVELIEVSRFPCTCPIFAGLISSTGSALWAGRNKA